MWTPGETIALAVAATALAATTIVWAASQLAVVIATGRFTAFAFGDATAAAVLLDRSDPLAALPADVIIGSSVIWWTALATLTLLAAAGGWRVQRATRSALCDRSPSAPLTAPILFRSTHRCR